MGSALRWLTPLFILAVVAGSAIELWLSQRQAANVARHKQRKIRWRGNGEWVSPRQAGDQTFERCHDGRGARKRRGSAAPFDGNPR